ncbi:Glycogen accumulation regulator GarA [Symmachiella macrocystis]|uniref:Glycogen accumulation regulator GarA n=1 Tax=Symmachiella macrocystis TaxID=2527985 RepID=A0A5C6AW44_9PLAN|nr:FHA domain-containing protein [Symmachiella macrocystis]TWU04163.1 Glycogen accumulation regulator GarA [Symmachiella macrocystis]
MPAPNQPIRIHQDDLHSPSVEESLQQQAHLGRDVGEMAPQSWLVRTLFSSWFYLSVTSGLGAFVAWMILEPFFDDSMAGQDDVEIVNLLLFPTVAGFIGLFLGAAEGIMCRNASRAVISGAIGLGVGFGGGLIALVAAGCIFTVMTSIALEFWENPQDDEMPTGFALLILMMGRAAAWAVASIPAGLGQGIAIRQKKVVLNGVVGGVLGGLVGGLLFDPISLLFVTDDGEASLSRAIGLTCIGLSVGLFVGLVEGWTKTAWLLMQKGPLAGKQFVMYRDTTVLGSSPKADIYLFKDDVIEPRHALIHNRGGRFELEDCQTPDGTYVNGIPIKRHVLHAGDQIGLGKTVLEFSVKEKV